MKKKKDLLGKYLGNKKTSLPLLAHLLSSLPTIIHLMLLPHNIFEVCTFLLLSSFFIVRKCGFLFDLVHSFV